MATPSELVFVVVRVFLDPYLIGTVTVGLALFRELFPGWKRHQIVEVLIDLLLVALIILLTIVVGVHLVTSSPVSS